MKTWSRILVSTAILFSKIITKVVLCYWAYKCFFAVFNYKKFYHTISYVSFISSCQCETLNVFHSTLRDICYPLVYNIFTISKYVIHVFLSISRFSLYFAQNSAPSNTCLGPLLPLYEFSQQHVTYHFEALFLENTNL